MSPPVNAMISDFAGKPRTDEQYRAIHEFVIGLGDVTRSAASQVSYAVHRKFLWLWAYERTADGTLYLNVTLDHEMDLAGIHRVTQTSAHRWNHHVEVKSLDIATSPWLRRLITEGYEFASR